MTNYEQLMAMLQAERAQPQYRRNEFGVPVELLSAGMDGYVDPASINWAGNGKTGNEGIYFEYKPATDQFAVSQGDSTSGIQRWLASRDGVQDLGFEHIDRKGNWNRGAATLAAIAAGGTLAAYGGGLMGAAGSPGAAGAGSFGFATPEAAQAAATWGSGGAAEVAGGAGASALSGAAPAVAGTAPAATGALGGSMFTAGGIPTTIGMGTVGESLLSAPSISSGTLSASELLGGAGAGGAVLSSMPSVGGSAPSQVPGGTDWSKLLGGNGGLLSAGLGALAGIAGNDNMQNTQTGSSGLAPWMQPYAQDVVARQQFMANQPASNWALDTSQGLLGQYATQGTPLTNDAMAQQQNVINGGMLNSNPYIDQVAQNIGSRMGEAYATGTRAGTFDRFSGDGNSPLGKSAFRQTLGNQDRAFGDALGSTMSNLYYGNYQNERAAQDAAARGSTGLANFGVQNAGLLGQSGADAWQRPYTQLQNYQSALSPAFGQQTSSTQNIQAPNNWLAGAGGAAMGAGLWKSIFG